MEETGFSAAGPFAELGEIRQKSGKRVRAWAFAGDADPSQLVSNICKVEWPPRSGRRITIPEVDRGRWFSMEEAQVYIRDEQRTFLQELAALHAQGKLA
jgi:predicted NUDIX family NTP pyrophosphohydrolase